MKTVSTKHIKTLQNKTILFLMYITFFALASNFTMLNKKNQHKSVLVFILVMRLMLYISC